MNLENGPGVQTDASGVYAIQGLGTGSYKIQYSDCRPTPNDVSQWFLGRSDPGSADRCRSATGLDSEVLVEYR